MSAARVIDVEALLMDVEAVLRQQGYWQFEEPSAEKLASQQPFCIDTLSLPQWLQFVFLPRMRALIAAGQALPSACQITPMAQQYFSAQPGSAEPLLAVLAALDARLTQP